MFSRAASVFVLALPLIATATVLPRTGPSSNQCNSGSLQCCNSTSTASDPVTSLLLGLLGINVGSVTGIVGLTCSPLTIIGASGTGCSNQAVCCTNNTFNGVVALGCTPININV
ncbi:hydrophobin [Phlegmacium glaucopus]|nr:hydrophobin [Phlegmacium glaucopus]